MRVCVALLACVLSLAAQQPGPGNWDNLRQLNAGQAVQVVQTGGKATRGTFLAYSEDSISLHSEDREFSIPKADVKRVTLRDGSRRKRNMLLGLAIGGAVGGAALGIWAKKAQPRGQFRGEYYDIGKWIFLPAGLGAGAAIGGATSGDRTVYQADPNPVAGGRR